MRYVPRILVLYLGTQGEFLKMKTKTWFIYYSYSQPFWDSEEQQLIWIDSECKRLDLPIYISTQEEAEEFLKQSSLKELGTEYVEWFIREC